MLTCNKKCEHIVDQIIVTHSLYSFLVRRLLRERQIENKINKQNRNRLIDTENRLTVVTGERAQGLGERIKYKLLITE